MTPWNWADGIGPDGIGVEEHFELNCQNVPGAAGAAAGAAAAASAAASAGCIYYVVIGGRFAPPYKYIVKYKQQKQQQKQQLQSFLPPELATLTHHHEGVCIIRVGTFIKGLKIKF